MKHTVQYGSKSIDFTLTYSSRKTLGITVTPDMEVMVKAPEKKSLEEILAALRKRASWILKQQSFFLTFHPRTPEKRYVSGESHLYLGRQYRLRIVDGSKNGVHFNGRELILTKRPRSSAKTILDDWYRMKAREVFASLAEPLIHRFEKYSAVPQGLFLQSMPTRWGSCTPGGKLILNPELIKAPKRCIEYVIVHELCHLVHRNHTAAFFKLQIAEMADWEKWKERLERVMG